MIRLHKGAIKDIKPKRKNIMGKVIKLTVTVVTMPPIILLKIAIRIRLFDIIKEDTTHPSIAKKESIRLTDIIEYGEIIHIKATERNISVTKSARTLK